MAERRWAAPFQYQGEERPGTVTAEDWLGTDMRVWSGNTSQPYRYQVPDTRHAVMSTPCDARQTTRRPAWRSDGDAEEIARYEYRLAEEGYRRPARWRRWVYAGLMVVAERRQWHLLLRLAFLARGG